MEHDILQQLEDAKTLYKGNTRILDEWAKRVKDSVLLARLGKTDAMVILIGKFEEEIASIERRLLLNKPLTQTSRELLLERRNWCKEFVNFFERSEKNILNTKKRLDNNITN